ncbi:hypothetical protein GF312_07620 [Candidatus Poribacteria bacterium]|nr:hypothetical protein [Candidatus Poribacteria bacterium]
MPSKVKDRAITIKSLLVALILIPLNCYWIIQVEIIWYSGHPTCISLFQNAVFSLLVVSVMSLLLKRLRILRFSEGELIFIYITVVMASSVASHDLMQILVPTIPHLSQYATPENEWMELFGNHIPEWLAITEEKPVIGYYEGESTFYTAERVKAWLSPIIWWSLFIFAMYWIMLSINTLFRKQWTENEKLSYPIIQLPLALVQAERSNIFKNKMLWLGFSVAAALDLLNGIGYLVPSVPVIPVKLHDIGKYFNERPFNAMGWTPISFYPFSIGLSFFMPLDLAFSTWFFYLFRKMQMVLSSAIGSSSLGGFLGSTQIARFPYLSEQSAGAFIVLFGVAIYLSRRHLRQVFSRHPDDKEEPIRYVGAFAGILLGMAFITFFCLRAGMDLWVVLLFFFLYFAISVAITRMRAELGPPTHELTGMNAGQMMVNVFGSRRIGPRNLLMISHYFWFFNRTYRNHAMPHQLEGLKMTQRTGTKPRIIVYAVLIGTVFGLVSAFWADLHISYKVPGAPGSGFSWESMRMLTWRLSFLRDPDLGAINFMFLGGLFTVFLTFMRIRFLWWPFHPVGYALSMNFGVDYIWFTLVIGSALKWGILRFGGLGALRKATPFFLGLILGEYAVGSFWNALSVLIQKKMYVFWIF